MKQYRAGAPDDITADAVATDDDSTIPIKSNGHVPHDGIVSIGVERDDEDQPTAGVNVDGPQPAHGTSCPLVAVAWWASSKECRAMQPTNTAYLQALQKEVESLLPRFEFLEKDEDNWKEVLEANRAMRERLANLRSGKAPGLV